MQGLYSPASIYRICLFKKYHRLLAVYIYAIYKAQEAFSLYSLISEITGRV